VLGGRHAILHVESACADKKERKEGRRNAYLLPCVIPFSTHLKPLSARTMRADG
jgi:hypothetical protein